MSRPAWDAWIEIKWIGVAKYSDKSRVPHGTRGLKCDVEEAVREQECRVPHGTRGLKSCSIYPILVSCNSRVPHGTRGLKCDFLPSFALYHRRVPHGTRGLKCRPYPYRHSAAAGSRPAWDAWIEILLFLYIPLFYNSRVPHGTRGLKYTY